VLETLPDETALTIRLNKYLAHAGIAARRKADELIAQGSVTVNGQVIKEMGYRVLENDVVKYKGKIIKPTKNYIYILLNKPKNVVTTSSDEKGRKTVLDIVQSITTERVYPVGRLDKNTTGVLLITNDGALAQHLSHPSSEIKKVYHVELNKALLQADFEKIKKGLQLEDGKIVVDEIAFPKPENRLHVGVEIHSGKNRIVRRIFEHLNYEVVKLDRVMFGTLTKKNVLRGKYRVLEKMEVLQLKKI
jgi:23S rRNA pseudouridine2605 synthase